MEIEILISLLALSLLGGLFIFLIRESSRRRKLELIAEDLDLKFTAYVNRAFLSSVKQDLPLFARGKTDSISNLMHGRLQNTSVRLFDYEYWLTWNRKWAQRLTVLWLDIPGFDVTRFTVHPKSWANNLEKSRMNCNDHVMYGDNEVWLQQLCKIIKDDSRFVNLTIEGHKSNIILYKSSGMTDERIPPKKENYLDLIDAGIQLYKWGTGLE